MRALQTLFQHRDTLPAYAAYGTGSRAEGGGEIVHKFRIENWNSFRSGAHRHIQRRSHCFALQTKAAKSNMCNFQYMCELKITGIFIISRALYIVIVICIAYDTVCARSSTESTHCCFGAAFWTCDMRCVGIIFQPNKKEKKKQLRVFHAHNGNEWGEEAAQRLENATESWTPQKWNVWRVRAARSLHKSLFTCKIAKRRIANTCRTMPICLVQCVRVLDSGIGNETATRR